MGIMVYSLLIMGSAGFVSSTVLCPDIKELEYGCLPGAALWGHQMLLTLKLQDLLRLLHLV